MLNNTREVVQIWSQKDQLEQTFLSGFQGEPEIKQEEKNTYLGIFGRRLLLSEKLIAAVGKQICETCLHTILAADPREAINYSKLTWLDRLTGARCPAHQD